MDRLQSAWLDDYGEWQHGYRCADCDYCVLLDSDDFEDILKMDAGFCRLTCCLVETPREQTETARECLGG